MTGKALLATFAICAAGLIAFGVWLSRQLSTPHFSITERDGGIALHSLWLGEYSMQVQEMTIVDERNSVVARFVAKTEEAMMHTVTVNVGKNDFKDLYLDGYAIEGRDYEFKVGVEYTAHIRWPSREAELRFMLKEKQPNQALQTTSMAPSVFERISDSYRHRLGV